MPRKIVACIALAGLLAGPLALPAGATYGGKPLAADDPARKSVVMLKIDAPGWQSYCSGVIYAEDVVATAAHCLFRSRDAQLPVQPETISIRYHHDPATRTVTRIRFSQLLDLALLTTESRHPKGYVVPELDMRSPQEIARQSAQASFVYFGHGPQSHSQANRLTRLESVPLSLQVHQGVRLRMQHTGDPTPKGTCGGDSGGAVMIQAADGQLKLLGVHQAGGAKEFRISDNCTRLSIFSTIGRLKDWEPDLLDAARMQAAPPVVGGGPGSATAGRPAP